MKNIPTIQEIYSQVEKTLKNHLEIPDDENLKKAVDAIASVLSGQLKLMYLYMSDIQRNALPDKADSFENGGDLNRHGMIYLGRLPFPPTDGKYKIKISGSVGSVLRSGLTFKSNEDSKSAGKMFILDRKTELNSTESFVEIRSVDSGLESLLLVGDHLTITEPVLGVDFDVEVVEVVQSPTTAESVEDYRKAILDSIQIEPFGGSKGDYIIWSKDAEGVKNVFPYVKENESGVVQIYVEATSENSIDGLGTPTESMIRSVEAVINYDPDETKPELERSRKPIQAKIEVLPIILRPIDIEISGIQDDSNSVMNLLKNNIEIFLKTIRPFIDGANLERNRNDILSLGNVQFVVIETLTSSNYFSDLILKIDGEEIQSYQFKRASIPYLRTLKINGQNV